jgi:hypothetical protein
LCAPSATCRGRRSTGCTAKEARAFFNLQAVKQKIDELIKGHAGHRLGCQLSIVQSGE